MGERLDLLRLEVETGEEATGGGEFGDEGDDLHFLAAEGTKEGIYFEDPSNELSPGEPSLSNELGGGVLVGMTGGGLRLGQGASSAMERGIGIGPPIAHQLLPPFGDVVRDAGDEFKNVKALGAAERTLGSGRAGTVENLSSKLILSSTTGHRVI